MKVVILAGGYGTRLSEETRVLPKPMIEIGGMPILWHIMKYYYSFGHKEFIICLGYKGYIIKEYFYNYWLRSSDITLRTLASGNDIKVVHSAVEDWSITLADTGHDVQTGLRIKNIEKYIGNDSFMLTYGDGVSDVDLNALVEQHKNTNNVVTITAIQPQGRFGEVDFDGNKRVSAFNEKRKSKYINAGFMVAEPELFKYLGKNEPLEFAPFEAIVRDGKLGVYPHEGFWKCMDTLSDLNILERIWNGKNVPWKVWE
ncbi:glucose-1-phosphate cytidylyltransferase [Oxobacter pfennigii]|uniref:Glucose-1-phosphate cytidylyltransferase n=1 Tax=Oxobacter pfennigii TaxID=36849 RepID=A0A0P8WQ26_9CLOT|nr:glucose-1-phosphate cytidylyltransferase [Oxobacter pfennigii]KPU44670.1 glucose-1-phosphate cytidylyltransferase [Oxobacter pfennigii]